MDAKTANVLVVADDAAAQETCQSIVQEAGFRAMAASSQALPSVNLAAFDVVFIDLDWTGRRGLALLDEIKARRPEIEAIGVAADQRLDEAKAAVRSGATDFLAKPLSPAAVTAAVIQALDRAEWTIHLARPETDGGSLAACWIEYEGDGQVTVGLERGFLETLDAPLYIELPLEEQPIGRGETLLRVLTRDGRIHVVGCPVAGCVLRINEALLWDVDEIRQPSWAVRLKLAGRQTHGD